MRSPIKTILTAIVALTVICSATAQSYDLKLKLKKGQKLTQSMVMDMNMKETVKDQEIKIGTKMKFVYLQEVKAIDANGNYNMECTFKRIAMDMNAMGQALSYDSDKKPEAGSPGEEIGKTFGAMLNKKFTVVVSPKGKVVKVTGIKEIMESLSAGASPTSKQLLASTFDESKIAENFSSSYDFFPEKPIKKGESWTRTKTMESVFPITMVSTYTLKEVKGNIATINLGADIKMKSDSVTMQGMTAKVDMKGRYDGNYMLDLTTGVSNSASLAMPIKGTIEIMSMQVPMEMDIKMEITTTK